MKRLSIFLFIVFAQIVHINWAQSDKKSRDRESIKNMCGCFEVEFRFSETFSYSDDNNYMPSKTKVANALEFAHMVEEDDNKVMIQHLLLVGDESNPYIIKHWRQDWIYENRDLLMYDSDNTWKYVSKPKKDVRGQWTQKVFQVDDSPRYEGSSSWVHIDGKSYWENSTYAPLPRREYTKRNDYNIMIRGNRHEIINEGWIHDQDNYKVVKDSENDSEDIIAAEKGYSTYTRVEDSRCNEAINWWNDNNTKWSFVREKWNSIYSKNNDLRLKRSVEDRPLFSYLFDDNVTQEKEIGLIIDKFVVD